MCMYYIMQCILLLTHAAKCRRTIVWHFLFVCLSVHPSIHWKLEGVVSCSLLEVLFLATCSTKGSVH